MKAGANALQEQLYTSHLADKVYIIVSPQHRSHHYSTSFVTFTLILIVQVFSKKIFT
jgi:hypothetical protein